MKVHILASFPVEGDSRGTTKNLDAWTAESLIAEGYGVSAEDGKPHPEHVPAIDPEAEAKAKEKAEAKEKADAEAKAAQEKADKEAETRQDKTNKAANSIKTK